MLYEIDLFFLAVGKQEPVTRDSTVFTMAENTGNSVQAGGDTSQGQGKVLGYGI